MLSSKYNSFACRVSVAWVVFAASGLIACEKEDESDPVVERCTDFSVMAHSCAGIAIECPETGPCATAQCLDHGHGAVMFSETCGTMWHSTYECVIALSCPEYEQWFNGHLLGNPDYPCMAPEAKFRDSCPDLPLFDGES